MGSAAQARAYLSPGDIERADTSQAIVTVSMPNSPQTIKAIRFPVVPDLQSCFSLAYSAVARTRGESSATCINEHGVVAATYFCKAGQQTPECEIVTP
jgi:hypothetical protein